MNPICLDMLSCGMRNLALLLLTAACVWAADATYTGAASCAPCHADVEKHWAGARHSKMVQPATKSSVRGDFTRGKITLRGEAYQLTTRNGAWYITESYLTGKPREHRIDYTLGNRRIQHYVFSSFRRAGTSCAGSGSITSI